MSILYKKVKIISNKFEDHGILHGVEGYVIEDHGDGYYDVEFSKKGGETLAILILSLSDFELVNDKT